MSDAPYGDPKQTEAAADAGGALPESPLRNSVPEPELETRKPSERSNAAAQRPESKLKRVWKWVAEKEKKAGLHDYLMVVFTGVLTIVAIGQAVLTYLTIHNSNTQFQTDERPWVGLQNIACEDCLLLDNDSVLSVGKLTANLTNTGKSPARDITSQYVVAVMDSSAPIPPIEQGMSNPHLPRRHYGESGPPEPEGTLAPSGQRPIILHEALKVPRGTADSYFNTYIFGVFKYRDQDNKQHSTFFCLVHDVSMRAHFEPCSTGNEMN